MSGGLVAVHARARLSRPNCPAATVQPQLSSLGRSRYHGPMPDPALSVASLHVYPVKGLRGLDLAEASLERQGLQHDRRWAILRPGGKVLTQRDLPAMARIDAVPEAASLRPARLRLECAGHGGIDAAATGAPLTLEVWGARVPALAANPEASAWLARVLGAPCTLAYLDDPAARPVTPDLARPGDAVSLADGFPLLVATTASLAALNARLDTPVPMARFRPNLVLDGAAPWAEDGWSHVQFAATRLRLASPCSRCTVTTVDQRTGAVTPRKEPLRTLGHLHRDADGRITFGWNAIPEVLGRIRVGEPGVPASLRS